MMTILEHEERDTSKLSSNAHAERARYARAAATHAKRLCFCQQKQVLGKAFIKLCCLGLKKALLLAERAAVQGTVEFFGAGCLLLAFHNCMQLWLGPEAPKGYSPAQQLHPHRTSAPKADSPATAPFCKMLSGTCVG